MSVGTLNDFGAGGAFLDSREDEIRGRVSIDLDQLQSPQRPLQRRRASSHALIETLPVTPPLHSVPFPTGSVRSASPSADEILRPGSRGSRLDLQGAHGRSYSSASLGSKMMLNSSNDEGAGQFAVRPSSPDRASRFDPKAHRGRTMSNGTMATQNMLAEENPFAVKPPSPSRSSRFDPKARGRAVSVTSMGTRVLIDNDFESEMRRDRPYSTVELLRPKVLVMPSPLQSVGLAPPPPSTERPRSGFQLSSDGPPLPPGARTAPRSSTHFSSYDSSTAPVASNSFTPNPRSSLTLSQLAFRNTLVVGGQRDVAYADIDRALPRAANEGEQAQFEIPEEKPESIAPASIAVPRAPPPTEAEIIEPKRPAGKLYGRSLIDNLEQRKANMRQKQRAFGGDDRPSMMVRGQIRRSSTFIDPESLQRPTSQNLDAMGSGSLGRRNSANAKPLLDMNGERPPTTVGMPRDTQMSKSRSVFGVDTLWDSEMAKLKEIEAQEKLDAEERQRREADEEERRRKKKKGKSKGKSAGEPPASQASPPPDSISESRVSEAPPTLPAIQKPILRRPPVVDDDESESESEASHVSGEVPARRGAAETAAERWVAESSEEEDSGPRRTTGVGLRYPSRGRSSATQGSQIPDEDSEEDLPLAAAAERVAKRATQLPPFTHGADDEDEDKPLSVVLNKAKLTLPTVDFDNLSNRKSGEDDDEDDEQPLGLRASRLPLASQTSLAFAGGEDDDDKPLAFHPEQQRRTQYQMLAQVQQQQQQMMMQAQMQQSMFFGGPAMMGSGFFGPPMAPPPMMMAPPPPMPSPPPPQDANKFGRVDRWRRDVAVEGEP
ncbi:hypothetical protein BV22DRAFT_1002684 [Leucogyrophana mollusca]|uniref:Uncharacterized protein n=1 Tax=Leucogyrophana mollusca TaxID=85980 RepID=A0ACB8BWH8_9AGAM|nr:hypothetical protein BV22DRAFT_1002684 [Leucogyrophana mollusca]